MPNKNYVRGRRFEYDVMMQAKKDPTALVFRTSGSHGPYDVIEINRLTNIVRLTQCKTKLTNKATGTVESELVHYGTFSVIGRKLTKYIRRR